jgi:peptidoglycan/xylan/chitin deacetylase (PgdA/CDA1 family)
MLGPLIGVVLGAMPVDRPAGPSDSPAPASHQAAQNQALRPPTTTDFAVPVLMYHRIADLPPWAGPLLRDLTVSPMSFEQQVRYLVSNNYAILTAGQVEHALRLREALPVKAAAITLDDGYSDSFEQAFPILHHFGLDGTLFLVTGTVQTEGHVSWAQARQMRGEGMEFGSHSVHHWDLTSLSDVELDAELIESRAELERQLETRIQQIAYPSGRYDERVKKHASDAGYLAGWKKGGGWVTPDSDPLMLPRVRVRGDTTMEQFIRSVTHRPATRWEIARYGS